jgi:beta-lactamase regulating signal transducer with metallopeptidase domain
MIAYIFKTILCSALLILIYHLFLEKEKMYWFNRFYLLFAIAFSFIVPLITIKTKVLGLPISESINLPETILQSSLPQKILPSMNDSFSLSNILILIYVTVTAFLFCRFIVNISSIFFKIRNNNSVKYLNAKLILTKDSQVPHSFLNYVFVHFNDFERGTIDKEILSHELTHVKQRHSLDILFIELLMIFAWINPLLFLYRKAVQLNHEFLADEFVVNKFSDTLTYQLLLVDKATKTNNLILSSPFNYLLTKKRIIMMSKRTSPKVAILKQMALIPMIAATGFLFTSKSVAQDLTKVAQEQISSTQNGVSQELLKEYQDLLDKYKRTTKDGKEGYFLNLNQEDKERLETIFFQMSKEQQTKQKFVFIPRSSMVLPKIVPTKEQLESFKDPKTYGVWIDGVQVSNKDLDRYKNTDFAFMSESKLMKNAINYGKYVSQVDLMTNEGYQTYYSKTISEKGYVLMAQRMVTK